MPADATEDEGLHPAGDDPDWQESAYLAWRDPASGLGGNHRIGNELNRGTANLWCGVYHEGGGRFRWNGEGLPLVRLDQAGVCAGPQRLFHDGERLRFVLDGDGCRAELEITDEGPRSFANAQSFTGTAGDGGHDLLQQLPRRLPGPGHGGARRHPGGGRRPGLAGPLLGRAPLGQLPLEPELRRLAREGDETLQFRYGSHGGRQRQLLPPRLALAHGEPVPVAGAEMLLHVDDDSVRCPSAEVRYRLEDGGTTCVRIETIGGMIGATAQRYGWESVGDVSVNGEPGGWGFLETNLNARNGQNPPAFVLADALTNGFVRVDAGQPHR